MFANPISRRDWLKVSSVGALGLALPGTALGHDMSALHGLHFALTDVRDTVRHEIHPRTGLFTTQNERRALAETRYVAFWKAFRQVQQMYMESPAPVQAAMKRHMSKAHRLINNTTARMHDYTAEVLSIISAPADTRRTYKIGRGVFYPWGYPGQGSAILRECVKLNPEWAGKHCDADLLGFLGVKIDKGVPSMLAPPIFSSLDPRPQDEYLGMMHNQMQFRPLTDKTRAVLDDIQRTHDAWVTAAKDKATTGDLDALVRKHHQKHDELEYSARDHDELSLLALQPHTHDIDWTRPKAEIDPLLDEANTAHREWVKAVKDRDLVRAWQTGAQHTRFHILLGAHGVVLDNRLLPLGGPLPELKKVPSQRTRVGSMVVDGGGLRLRPEDLVWNQ